MEKNDIIENSCIYIINEFKTQGMSDSKNNFLLDYGVAVQKGIQNIKIPSQNYHMC
ncbi:hypothetical protein [Desulfobacula toluolica]|uniref:hypothetical protein n=1 Tax=Desulfobacula toluolica TaxID=28223 RepID=UPI0003196193|nr:hypothetical protein [Desulfobacula toluolica]